MKISLFFLHFVVLIFAYGCASDPPKGSLSCQLDQEICRDTCVPVGTCQAAQTGEADEVGPTGGSTGDSIDDAQTSLSCSDTATTGGSLNGQYQGVMIPAGNGPKNYYLQSNWWYLYESQSITYNGLSFVVGNPTNASVDNRTGTPIGYPSLFIGSYAGHETTQSNLPRKVTEISSAPTVFATNATQNGIANHNAAYDIWFTPDATPLTANQYKPPEGGAYLMIWLFDPTDRQPRGSKLFPAHTVDQVSGSWDVWVHPTDPPCITYVSTTLLDSLDFDLNHFIQDSVTNNYGITADMYLSIIFAGFEIWGGGDGLRVDRFCAQVN